MFVALPIISLSLRRPGRDGCIASTALGDTVTLALGDTGIPGVGDLVIEAPPPAYGHPLPTLRQAQCRHGEGRGAFAFGKCR
ncbi:MAG: hypothetical protein LDLANPLL_01431 [Turneriella sp.]|nr:hypothetical protein [Turneriella sp.]